MATRNPYAGWTNFAGGYLGTNAGPNSWEPNYQNWADYARGYAAAHPSLFPPAGQAPAAPPAAPAGPTPPPFDAIYENAISGINRTYGDQSAQINYDESQLSPTYGYQTDTAGNVSVDPSNPFSKAALLQRNYDQGQTGSTNRMAAQGQLYSGALQNTLNQGTFQNQSATDALKRAYQNAVQNIGQRRRTALTTQQLGIGQAGSDRIARALANRPTS